MLQRIQSIFLLGSSLCMLLSIVLTLITFNFNGTPATFEAMGIYVDGELHDSTWGLFILGGISSVVSLITMFMFKKRMLQIRLTTANMVIMAGFYLFVAFLVYRFNSGAQPLQFVKIGAGMIMPLISFIFSLLAVRRIGADEALVRSLDRLRR